MMRTHFLSIIIDFALARIHWRMGEFSPTYRLLRWGMRKQLDFAQSVGQNVDIVGPIYAHNLGYIEIGDHVTFRSSWHRPISLSVERPNARLVIEPHAFVNWGVNIGIAQEVIIGSHTQIADECIIYDTDWHDLSGNDGAPSQPVYIGRNVWLGTRTIVLKGVQIGDNTVVGANSTVTKDLPPNVLEAGNPARVIRDIERNIPAA